MASGGKPFVSTALLADMIFISLPQRHEIGPSTTTMSTDGRQAYGLDDHP